MTREIEFRGFDGREWRYGDLTYYRKANVALIRPDNSKRPNRRYLVDPDTVGEFTGMTDKDGVKIFEGDIVGFGKGRYVCEFVEGGFQFKDLDDGRLTLNAIAIKSKVIGNMYDNPELLNKK